MNEVMVTKTKKRNVVFGTKTNEEVILMGIIGASFFVWLMILITLLGIFMGLILSAIIGFAHFFVYGILQTNDKEYNMPKFKVLWYKIKSSKKKKIYFYDYKVTNDGKIKIPQLSKQVQEEINALENASNE